MQYTINSNEALRNIIYSKCTYVGRYRQGVLQLEEALRNIEQLERTKRKLNIDKKLKEMETEELRKWDGERHGLQRERILIEIEEIDSTLLEIEKSLKDYYREAKVCRECLEQIKEESGVDYSTLSTEEFQDLMKEEYYLNYARNLAAQIISSNTNCPLPVAQSLVEMTEGEREMMRERVFQIVNKVSLLKGQQND